MAIFNSLEDCKKAIAAMEAAHLEIPPTILEEKERLEVTNGTGYFVTDLR